VLALAGMSRLLRAHLRTLLAVLPRFQDGWQELMLVVESSMAGGRHETAVAAVGLLTNVLQVVVTADVLLGCFTRASIALIALWWWLRSIQPLTFSMLRTRHMLPQTLCQRRCGSGRSGRWVWA
jgi:hypothetical protein